MEVVSLFMAVSGCITCRVDECYLHRVAGEKGFKLPLSGRVGEVSNIKTTTFSSSCDDCLILGSVDRLTTSSGVGSFRCDRSDGGSRHGLGDAVDCRHGFDVEIEMSFALLVS